MLVAVVIVVVPEIRICKMKIFTNLGEVRFSTLGFEESKEMSREVQGGEEKGREREIQTEMEIRERKRSGRRGEGKEKRGRGEGGRERKKTEGGGKWSQRKSLLIALKHIL